MIFYFFLFFLIGNVFTQDTWYKVDCIIKGSGENNTGHIITKDDTDECSCGDKCVETRYFTSIKVLVDEKDGNLNDLGMYRDYTYCDSGEDSKSEGDDWIQDKNFKPGEVVTCYINSDYVSYEKPPDELGLILGLSLGLGIPILCLICLPCTIFCCLLSIFLLIVWVVICCIFIVCMFIVIVVVIIICILVVIVIFFIIFSPCFILIFSIVAVFIAFFIILFLIVLGIRNGFDFMKGDYENFKEHQEERKRKQDLENHFDTSFSSSSFLESEE